MDELSAVDRLRLRQLDGAKPPSMEQMLKDAVLELDERVTLMLENPAVVINAPPPPNKPGSLGKALNPREDEGMASTADAPARAEPSGLPPPDGSPVPSSRYGMNALNKGLTGEGVPNAAKGESLQTRPEHD